MIKYSQINIKYNFPILYIHLINPNNIHYLLWRFNLSIIQLNLHHVFLLEKKRYQFKNLQNY